MEQQHPIPQHISSYQFRLVGDMTLKQFFQLAGGFLVSLLFYASPLHPLIKWPIILLSALLGIALAFLPFQDRPLETWIIAFFKSIYSPTMFFWTAGAIKKYFQDENVSLAAPKAAPEKTSAQLSVQKAGFILKLEETENSFLSKLAGLFTSMLPTTIKPQAGTAPGLKPREAGFIPIPAAPPPPIERQKLVVEEKSAPATQGASLTSVAPAFTPQVVVFGKRAQFSIEAAPPNPPTTPNIVVGQVLDSTGKILDGTIMEIRDAMGRPVRALKSNRLGHFMIATPLSSGRYEIISEKEGYTFDPISFEAVGTIIPPIEIRAKAGTNNLPIEPLNNPTVQPLQQ
jgi:hypothetical protein